MFKLMSVSSEYEISTLVAVSQINSASNSVVSALQVSFPEEASSCTGCSA